MSSGLFQFSKSILMMGMLGLCAVAFGDNQDKELTIEPAVIGYTVGGNVTGLLTGSVLVLQNNGGNDLIVNANGDFTFTYQLPDGASYNVTVLTQPTSPELVCSVTNGSGTISEADITDVQVNCISLPPPPHATCPGGIGDEDALVTSYDYDSGGVIDCTATNSITLGPDVFVLNGTTLNLNSPLIYLKRKMAVEVGSQLRIQPSDPAPVPLRLNDTGIIYCADDTTDGWICPIPTHPGQDAEHGRDVDHYDDSDGHAGFSFTKLGANGAPLPASATSWSCVRDNVTGLIWEVKTDDGGLRDKDNSYTWYNQDDSVNGGDVGTQDGGNCNGSSCDTQGYVQAVNTRGLCGANNWRMPTKKELQNILSRDRSTPAIDADYFPNTVSLFGYWSATPATSWYWAWLVSFEFGGTGRFDKSSDLYVRLVSDR